MQPISHRPSLSGLRAKGRMHTRALTTDAAQVTSVEWGTSSFGADSKTFFEERLKQQPSDAAAQAALARYRAGGGNTPFTFGEWEPDPGDPALAQWREYHSIPGPYKLAPESAERGPVPSGTTKEHCMADCSVYPGTSHDWWSYTPAGYTPGTPLPTLFFCDGAGYLSEDGACRATIVLDNLISSGDIPPTCACFISPGTLHDPRPETNQRGYEYDSITPQFAEFLLADVIPAMASEAGLTVTEDPEWRGIAGISSSGVAAFAACWNRPDAFRKVISHVGSFTNIRGAHNLQYLVRTSERKPITVFLQSGSHDFDNSHGSWSLANQTLAQSLHYAGYRYKFAFGEGGHNMVHGGALLPQTLRWLWSAKEPPVAEEAAGVDYVGGHAFGWQPAQPYGGVLAKL